VIVAYEGRAIDPAGLLQYLVSYRNHQAFHETTIERIYADIWQRCEPQQLSVYGRFLRRGGIDINPYRSSNSGSAPRVRVARQ
jgi:7-cyano-7-deazaguanine reductase